MHFSEVISRQYANLAAAESEWRRQIGAAAIASIKKHWPATSFGSDVHPYATDRSLKAWEVVENSGASITVRCPVKYSGYTELGYTRKGPETARSWGIRDYGPYSWTALMDADLRGLTDRIIREALNG